METFSVSYLLVQILFLWISTSYLVSTVVQLVVVGDGNCLARIVRCYDFTNNVNLIIILFQPNIC